MKKDKTKKGVSKGRKKRKSQFMRSTVLLVIALAAIVWFSLPYLQHQTKEQSNRKTEIPFKKEGQLSFIDRQNEEPITKIDIEIAETDYETTLGLMYRHKMDDDQGMLFVFEQEEFKSFWMKETYITLDIVYVNSAFEIVKIHKHAQPLSEESLPSIKKAKYVVEVVGGFCDKHNVKEGDFIAYERE